VRCVFEWVIHAICYVFYSYLGNKHEYEGTSHFLVTASRAKIGL
jgi:hypothetical protein